MVWFGKRRGCIMRPEHKVILALAADIMKPRHSCRPRTCWAKHCKPPSEPCIVIGIQPLNYRKNGWPFASWNSQSFPNPMLLSQMPISVNRTDALIMTDWHTALVEILAGMTLASILTLPQTMAWIRIHIQTKNDRNMLSTWMTSPCLLLTSLVVHGTIVKIHIQFDNHKMQRTCKYM